MEMIEDIKEYATVCFSWIAVKSYYLIFNLSLLLEYLVAGGLDISNVSHIKLLNKIKKRIGAGQLVFSNDALNNIYSPSEIYEWKFEAGSNLSVMDDENRDKQIVKKLCEYCKQDFKWNINKKSLRGRNKEEFYEKTKISLFDFFYWYRIKVNYRDLEFLDSDVGESQFYYYYKNYYEATDQFFNAFTKEINRLSIIRFDKEMFW